MGKRGEWLRVPDSPVVLAYAAGVVDGEGHISVTEAFDRKRSISVSHVLRVEVTNCDPRLVNWFAENFGGKVRERTAPSRKRDKWSAVYGWHAYGDNAARLLKALAPYLVIKRGQAEIAVRFMEVRPERRGKLTTEVVEQRTEMAKQIRALNGCGPKRVVA